MSKRVHNRHEYFTIAQGLRGCYMPDSCYEIRVQSRRELRAALQWEADSIRDAGFIGCTNRAVSWLANAAWKARGKPCLPYVAPYGDRDGHTANYCFALQCAPSDRQSYVEYCKAEGV